MGLECYELEAEQDRGGSNMLQDKIRNTIKQSNQYDQRKLSRLAGINESSFSRFLNGYEALLFGSLVKIVKELFPEDERKIMAEYVLTQKSRNARFALEYCSLNDLPEQLEALIHKLTLSINPVDKEWAHLYHLNFNRKLNKMSLAEFFTQLEVFDPKEIEMKIMKQISKCYYYSIQKNHSMLSVITEEIEPMLNEVKSDFMRHCLNIRLGLTLNYMNMRKNELNKARYYSRLVLEQEYFERVKGIAYQHLGHSYLFEDYSKAEEYLGKAKQYYEKYDSPLHLRTVRYSLSFIQSYWKIEREFPFELNTYDDKSEYIYYLIQKGEKDRAKEVLREIDVDSISEWNKGFYYYYQGLLDNEVRTFYRSVKQFHLTCDHFHMRLPLQELARLGEKEDVLMVWAE